MQAYAERYQLGYTIGADLTGEIFRLYRLFGLPTQFFIGPDGVIRSVVLAPLTEAGRGRPGRGDPAGTLIRRMSIGRGRGRRPRESRHRAASHGGTRRCATSC